MPRNLIALAIGALVLAGCASGDEGTGAAPGPTSPATAPAITTTPSAAAREAAEGRTIATGPSEYGAMLFDSNDQAIYIWEVEDSSTSQCYDDCAEAWPPVLTEGEPVADGDVEASLLGTTERDDGTTQVTYNGHPLYFYAHEAPGEVECHNIATHGGRWWVVQPDGKRAP